MTKAVPTSISCYRIGCLFIIISCLLVVCSSTNPSGSSINDNDLLLSQRKLQGRPKHHIHSVAKTDNGAVSDATPTDEEEEQQPKMTSRQKTQPTIHKITSRNPEDGDQDDEEEADDADEEDGGDTSPEDGEEGDEDEEGEEEEGDNSPSGDDDGIGEFMFIDRLGDPIESKCFPLKLASELKIQTHVGLVCVKFKDETQETLQVTFNTSLTDYVMEAVQVSYGHSPNSFYPRINGTDQPDVSAFEPSKILTQPENVVVFDITLDPDDTMECYTPDPWTKYFVGHAQVHLKDERPETSVSVFGDGGVLYSGSNSKSGGAGGGGVLHASYFTMKLQCIPTPAPTESPGGDGGGFRGDGGSIEFLGATPAPSELITGSPSSIPSLAPSVATTDESVTSSPTAAMTTSSSPPNSPEPSSSPSFVPSPSPTKSLPPAALKGEKMVVGTSFIVITENSGEAVDDLPHEMIQDSFEGFARNILEEMHVSPSPKGRRQRHGRRHLEVLYDDSSFIVYDFLVNTDCIPNDEHAQAVQKSSALRPPPTKSQCHRAYARYNIDLIDEDPIEVCNTIRDGTLAGYFEGRLQASHERQFPDSHVQFQAGDFEYCVPIEDFVVPDHGDNEHWMDTNPLANLTTVRDDVKDANDKPWLIPLIVGLCLIFLLLLILAIWATRRGNEKHKRSEAKMARERSSLMR